jgi:hypothetical protein
MILEKRVHPLDVDEIQQVVEEKRNSFDLLLKKTVTYRQLYDG